MKLFKENKCKIVKINECTTYKFNGRLYKLNSYNNTFNYDGTSTLELNLIDINNLLMGMNKL